MTILSLNKTPQHLKNGMQDLLPGDTGVQVNGGPHSLTDYRYRGGGYGVKLWGSAKLTLRGFVHADPVDQSVSRAGYGIYSAVGDGSGPNRLYAFNAQIGISAGGSGQHCVRAYNAVDWIVDGGTFSHEGKYEGSSFNLKQISGGEFFYGTCLYRPASFGHDRKNNSEAGYLAENMTWVGWTFDMNGGRLEKDSAASPLVFSVGARNNDFYNCVFIQRNPMKAILRCENGFSSGMVVHPPAEENNMWDCKFYGGNKRVDGTNPNGIIFH